MKMDKETKNNLLGMAVYFCIAVLFGGGFGVLALIVHEDNDRCHYYNGEWNKGDLIRGCAAVAVGVAARYLLMGEGGWYAGEKDGRRYSCIIYTVLLACI